MDTKQLERFAQAARRQLHEQVAARLNRVLTADSAELRAKAVAIKALKQQIAHTSREAVVEKVAYTWFNRFCALRYMDVNHYTRVGVVSPLPGHTQPEILQEAKQGHVDERFASTVDARTVFGLLDGTQPSTDPQQEAYRRLLVGVCNAYHAVMPFMFETIDDYTELLMPDDLLSAGSILQRVREALTEENCRDVEVIGWLYQFYISEKKDAVMAREGPVPSADIPARTQLFTPHWIVRYMVENSLGRLWLLNHPESRLIEQMEYYIAPEEEITGFLRVRSPEEIRFCDPAAGSGHILTYAFDLLYAIYEEQGYNPVDIPRLILEKNLTGIEIDPRAGALAGFALTMKARAKDARFFRHDVKPDICIMEDVSFTPQELDAYMDAVGRDLFTQNVQDWLRQFEQATTFGSLIRPLVTDTAFIQARLDEAGFFQNLFLSHTHDKLRAVLRMTEALKPRYHVVVANPPYMGNQGMNRELKTFLQDGYNEYRSDLFAAFIAQVMQMAQKGGFVGLMTPFTWMFLSSYEELRTRILSQSTLTSLVKPEYHAFFDSAYVPICTFVLFMRTLPDYKGAFIDLSDFYGVELQPVKTLEAIKCRNCSWFYRASSVDLKKIPGVPILYSLSDRLRNVFESNPNVATFGGFKRGMGTGDNDRFLKYWHEVSIQKSTISDHPSAKWYLYNKGGNWRRWYGNLEYVVNWENDGYEIRHFTDDRGKLKSRPQNTQYNFKPSVSYSSLTSGVPSFRYYDNHINDQAGNFLPCNSRDEAVTVLGLLNSRPSLHILGLLSPTLNILIGDLNKIPISKQTANATIPESCVAVTKEDWNAYETSWDFGNLPLLCAKFRHVIVADSYIALRSHWQTMTLEMQRLEEENNRLFIAAYGLQDELSPDVPLNEITLTCNPHYRYGSARLKAREWEAFGQQFPETTARLAEIATGLSPDTPEETRLALEQRLLDDTMREFISYAVGCMFGRYSLDKPGLILANQGETLDDYLEKVSGQWAVGSEQEVTFMPEADNVIPVLDGDWFTNDITARFKAFLKVTFGERHYLENLAFIEAAIGRDVRSYFLREFYKDHVTMYKKRPIYWLFSSPNGSFNALVYMHRYRPDTTSVVLNDYLREYRAKLTARRQHLEGVSISAGATPREKTQALKESEALDNVLRELREYEDAVLYPLAAQQVEIDLDDGVAVNYGKLGKALRKI